MGNIMIYFSDSINHVVFTYGHRVYPSRASSSDHSPLALLHPLAQAPMAAPKVNSVMEGGTSCRACCHLLDWPQVPMAAVQQMSSEDKEWIKICCNKSQACCHSPGTRHALMAALKQIPLGSNWYWNIRWSKFKASCHMPAVSHALMVALNVKTSGSGPKRIMELKMAKAISHSPQFSQAPMVAVAALQPRSDVSGVLRS